MKIQGDSYRVEEWVSSTSEFVMTVTRGKDSVPSWDGNPSTWTEYRRAAYMYEETVKWENRYLCGPRLASELTGAAKAAIANKRRGWLSIPDGVGKLLRCLREMMSEPALPEIANQLRAYFKLLRRKRGESMAAFCVRHREEYSRTCKSLTRVLKEQKTLKEQGSLAWHSGRRRSLGTSGMGSAGSSTRGGEVPAEEHPLHGDAPEHMSVSAGENEGQEEESTDWGADWEDPYWWSGWQWYGQNYDWNWSSVASIPEDEQVSDDDEEDFIEILPEPIKGWLLLEKAGLDHMERSLIQSEVKGQFNLVSVENALRSHFTDDAIKRKDGDARHGAFYYDDEEEAAEEYWQEEDESFLSEVSDSAVAYFQQAKQDEQQAWAQIQQGRQTLREARARQHEVRMGRKFFHGESRKGKGFSKGYGQSRGAGSAQSGPCLRCGKSHDTKMCPQKKDDDTKNFEAEAEEHSEFVFSVSEDARTSSTSAFCWTNLEEAMGIDRQEGQGLSTQEVVKQGFGVLDGGATKTMGSMHALEQIQRACKETGQPGVTRVDTDERPVFGFGNSQRDQCASTCYLKMPTGSNMSLKIHALDRGSAPVLVSVDTLRRMGAIIDFRNDEAVFTTINSRRLVSLARSSAGHQLIPLTEDFMQSGVDFVQPVQSLRKLVQE